ncbi:MAG: undecaprenyl diphosphate synthase family protein [Euryarchaeota archaeon]|nr:undecaprenyl diphosphate synthase family protein [Euryarchaeota archaeon]
MDMLSFVHPLYKRYLTWQITRSSAKIPKHVALILKETDLLEPKGIEKLLTALHTFRKLKVELVSIYVDIIKADKQVNAELVSTLGERLKESFIHFPSETGYKIYGLEGEVKNSRPGKDFFVYISLGFGGRREITRAVTTLLEEVKSGRIRPDEVDEKMLESHLLVKHEPDIMIRSGGQKLSDFLVWQSVYSELFFTDVNWKDIRKIDLLRVIRDFQKRQRRYGK